MHIRRVAWLPILVSLAGCVTGTQPIPKDWLSVPGAMRIRSVSLAADGTVSPSSQPAQLTQPRQGIRVVTNAVGPAIANAEKTLTEPFMALDSFDVSQSRGEVVFSVKRDDNFDIGLVAVEGSDISWVPADRADEVAVQWAPRGNKISYLMRGRFGDVVRTLHIPTAFSLGVDFAFGRVHALGWDPAGERFAVAWSTPNASDAVDVLEYDGDKRKTAVKPAAKLDVEIQPLSGDAILLQLPDIRYNERLPLVIWVDEDRLSWNDARAELLRNARVALVVTSTRPDQALWQKAREVAWIDSSRAWVVGRSIGAMGGAVVISGEPTMAEGRSRRAGNVVSVPASVIESFAARFIAEQLKRNSPPNGSR